jgi:capsule polysaccharide export protein KpsE/RkpR
MRDFSEFTISGRAYAAAHAAHYSDRNLAAALQLYRELIDSRPNTPEAGYSRTQIRNIVTAVVPAQELLNAQTELALAQLEREESH